MHAGRRQAGDAAEDPGSDPGGPSLSRARAPARTAAALAALAGLAALAPVSAPAAARSLSPAPDSAALVALSFRSVGPTSKGGRVADLAVDPTDVSTFYAGRIGVDVYDGDGDIVYSGRLYVLLQRSSTPPTEDPAWQLDRVWEEAPGLLAGVNALTRETMADLFGSVYAADLRPETPEPVDVPARPGG